MDTTDRRVRRTKKLLKNSLAELLLEKELHTISVRELTDHADISRGTFYTHYQDIFDLYDQMENDFLKDLGEIVVEDPADEYFRLYEKVIDYVYDNANVCRTFMGTSRYKEKMSSFMEERYSAIVRYEMKTDAIKEEWKYLIRYHNEGFVAALALWMESGFSLPKETLLHMLTAIDDACDPLFK